MSYGWSIKFTYVYHYFGLFYFSPVRRLVNCIRKRSNSTFLAFRAFSRGSKISLPVLVLDIFLRDTHNQINVLRSTDPQSLTTIVLRWVKPQSIMTSDAWQYERQQNLIIYNIKINFLSTYNMNMNMKYESCLLF